MKNPELKDNPEFQKELADIKQRLGAKMEEGKKQAMASLLPFLVSLGTEGERSAVVLGAERLNVAVEALLKDFFLPSPNSTDNLFASDGALGTFSRKIEIAYRLGLVESRFRQALDLVRKLRNDFAHAVEVETLEKQTHADKVAALSKLITKGNEETLENLKSVFQKAGMVTRGTVCTYLACIMVLLLKLELGCNFLERPKILMPVMLNYAE